MLKIIDKIDLHLILKELEPLDFLSQQQTMLQRVSEQDINYGVGRLEKLQHKETDFIEPVYNFPYLNSIIDKLGMTRTRIMNMAPRSCYSYHQDPTPRIHIPLINVDDGFFVVDEQVVRMKADGSVYWLDTTLHHTAVNTSDKNRIHIVGCIYEKMD